MRTSCINVFLKLFQIPKMFVPYNTTPNLNGFYNGSLANTLRLNDSLLIGNWNNFDAVLLAR